MAKKCKNHAQCGGEVTGKNQLCGECQQTRTQLFYAHSELRFEMWNFLKHHGAEKVKELYDAMVKEEGEQWTRDVLGDKLVDEIQKVTIGSKSL